MSNVFVVTNQLGLFASKHKEWVDGREPKLLFRSLHKDEALNLVFELSSKDIYLRAEAISVKLGDNKQPIVEVTAELPPETEAIETDTTETDDTDTTDSALPAEPAEFIEEAIIEEPGIDEPGIDEASSAKQAELLVD